MITETTLIHAPECKCLSWKPIIAGALVAVGLTFLLNLFMVAVGVTAFTMTDGVEKLMLGGLLATGIGIIASMFAAGWITGYLGRNHCTKRHIGALYGFLAWSIALIIAMFLITHAQQYITLYGHFISGRAETIQVSNTAAAASVATDMSPKSVMISAYIIFSLFFLSAFSCSLGGHCGMRHRCRQDNFVA